MRLLGPADTEPVEVVNAESDHPLVMVCEHAGRAIPEALGTLGLGAEDRARHIAWDIGAEGVARRLAERLGAPLVLQRYSRLVIDCNRPPEVPSAMPEVSDGSAVPGNRGLTPQARAARVAEIFAPFDAAVTRAVDHPGRRVALAIHSFNPVMRGVARPWDIGLLQRRDPATAERLAKGLASLGLTIGHNQPYQISTDGDWFIPRHAERRGLAHCLVEIRNDHIAQDAGQSLWADRLCAAFATLPELAHA